MSRYYDRQGNPLSDTLEWARLFEATDRVVEQTTLPDGRWLSTVWLGLDHNHFGSGPPLIFETMVFKSEHDLTDAGCWRWSTEEDAKDGHARILAALRDGIDPDEVDA